MVLNSNYTVRSPSNVYFAAESNVWNNNDGCVMVNHFDALHSNPDNIKLSDGGHRILSVPNAGGNSVWSEVLSFEILYALFSAQLMRTEMELEYMWQNCKITDYSIRMFGFNVGVSVTRALKFRGIFSDEDARHLLSKKLDGVNASSRNVLPEQGWTKQILHVWAEHDYVAEVLKRVYSQLDDSLKANTFVLITVSNASYLYF